MKHMLIVCFMCLNVLEWSVDSVLDISRGADYSITTAEPLQHLRIIVI